MYSIDTIRQYQPEENIITCGRYNIDRRKSRFEEDVHLKKFSHSRVYADKDIFVIDSNINLLFYRGLARIIRSHIKSVNTTSSLEQRSSESNILGKVDAQHSIINRMYSRYIFCQNCDVKSICANSVNLTKTKVCEVTIKQFSIFTEVVITGKVYFYGKELIVKDSKVNEIIIELLENDPIRDQPIICLVNSEVQKINFINTFGEAYLFKTLI